MREKPSSGALPLSPPCAEKGQRGKVWTVEFRDIFKIQAQMGQKHQERSLGITCDVFTCKALLNIFPGFACKHFWTLLGQNIGAES